MNDSEKARLLILETSGQPGQVAVALGPHIRARRHLDEARRHARDLAPAVAELLAEQGWRPRDLNAVLVSRGPGSYTGLRVGLISATTLAYAAGCAIIGIDTFAAIARQAPAEASPLAVLADAQQEKVYVQQFSRAGSPSTWQADTALAIVPFSKFLGRLEEHTFLTGPALHFWANRLPATVRRVEHEHWHPRVESLLELGLDRLGRGETDDLWSLEPLYARSSAAEQKWQERSGSPEAGARP